MFQRAHNPVFGYRSRCLLCARIVTEGLETEAELAPFEARHLCPQRVQADQQTQLSAPAEPPAPERTSAS